MNSASLRLRKSVFLCSVLILIFYLSQRLIQGSGITYPSETGNNTSACSAVGTPSYCNEAFPGFSTNSTNTGAQTVVVDPPPSHVSNVSLHNWMYSGWTGKMICEYQPWFDNVSPFNGHKDVGYNENDSATVQGQDSAMIRAGCNINLIDWYGVNESSQSFNLTTSNLISTDLNGRANFPLKFGILEDGGSFKSLCPTNGNGVDQTTCIQNALITDMDYIDLHYAGTGAYWLDGTNPVVAFFISESGWTNPSPNWTTIWNNVKAHTNNYAKPFKFLFEFGSFSHPQSDGEYGWPQPPAWSSTQQFWWGSSTGATPTYLQSLYDAGKANPSKLTVGIMYKGFDDNNASWGSNRVIAEQCGQVLQKTASEVTYNSDFGTGNQLPYMQVATWNDYEEGTEVETGVDNCYTVTASLASNTLDWTLHASNSYATTSTIHHFTIYYENPSDSTQTLNVAKSGIAATATSQDLSTIVPTGTWNIYLEMVGKPLIMNRISGAVQYTH